MPGNEGFRKYVEAGAVLGQITRARAEEIVRELVGSGDVPRGQAQQWVDDLVDRSRRASEELLDLIRGEVRSQLAALGVDAEDLARQVADILRRSAEAGRQATGGAGRKAGGKKAGGAKKTAATKKSAGTKKTAATKKSAGTKKTAAKKSAGTKKASGAKKTAAKKKAAS